MIFNFAHMHGFFFSTLVRLYISTIVQDLYTESHRGFITTRRKLSSVEILLGIYLQAIKQAKIRRDIRTGNFEWKIVLLFLTNSKTYLNKKETIL